MSVTGKPINKSPASIGRRGFTLTELAIVLGIIGIILGTIWIAAGTVYENNRTQRASAQVAQIISGFKSIYGGRRVSLGNWPTDITSMAINNQFLPADMLVSGVTTNGVSPWNGNVNIYSAQDYNGIGIVYWNLNQAACNHFANAVATTNPGLVMANISGTGINLPPVGASAPFTTTNVNSYCQSNSNNYVEVIYSMN